jgi:hypothetical protein
MINLTPQQLRKAADIQEKIQSLKKELGQILGGEVSTPAQAPNKKGKMSAAGRAAIRAAQKARLAKIKGATSAKPAKKAKRKMSAAGLANIRAGVTKRMAAKGKAAKPAKAKIQRSAAWRAAISAAAKARWAKAKKAGKSRL